MRESVATLLHRYWAIKQEIAKQLPALSGQTLDTIAEAVAKQPAPEAAASAQVPPALNGEAEHGLRKVEQANESTELEQHPRPTRLLILEIMGDRTMTIGDIYHELARRGALPLGANPRQYISAVLAKAKNDFAPVPSKGRGVYRAIRKQRGVA